jgi:uncharacterized membrane protein
MRFLIAILALIGVVVSVLSLRIHNSLDTEPCHINEKWDCGIVNRSPYSEVVGIPVATIGIAGYLALASLALIRKRTFTFISAFIGMAFSLYLAHIERDILMVWCLYCMISMVDIALITTFSMGWMLFWGKRTR